MGAALKAFISAPEEAPAALAPAPVAWKPGDSGNAQQFAAWLAENAPARYDWTSGKFFIWTGTHYQADEDGKIERLADSFISYWLQKASSMIPEQREMILKRLTQLHKRNVKTAMIDEIRHLAGIAATATDFDAPGYFSFRNGVLAVKSGELHPHCKDKLLTKFLNYDFLENSKSELWESFQNEIASFDLPLVEAKQRAFGSVLSGFPDRNILLLFGERGTGKTVETEILLQTLGNFAGTTSSSVLLKNNGERLNQEILRHKGKVLIVASETPQGASWNPDLKKVSGGDSLDGRALHKEFKSVKPSFTICIHTNFLPSSEGDSALLERLKIFPYRHRFIDSDSRKPISEILQEYDKPEIKSAIFAWLYAGFKAYQKRGLIFKTLPASVQALMESYREDEDIIGNWISQNTVMLPGYWTSSKELYQDFERYCKDSQEKALPARDFSKEIVKRGFTYEVRGGRVKWFKNITLKPDEANDIPIENRF
jgi:putative DNA primase/helicase